MYAATRDRDSFRIGSDPKARSLGFAIDLNTPVHVYLKALADAIVGVKMTSATKSACQTRR